MKSALSLRSVRSTHDPKLIERLAAAAHAIRSISIAAIQRAGSGHPADALSAADVLAALYGAEMNIWPGRLADPDRDRFVLSEGHTAPALYAAGAHFGFCTADDALTLRGHFASLPWIETRAASPSQGLSVAVDIATGLKLKGSPARVYAMLGDVELQDAEMWEATMAASHYRVDNLLAIVDGNRLQSDDSNANIMGLRPLDAEFRAYGWHVIEVDGHDLDTLVSAFEEAFEVVGKPAVVLAHTVKGKGVPFMENAPQWNGRVTLSRQQAEDALKTLGCSAQDCTRLLDVPE